MGERRSCWGGGGPTWRGRGGGFRFHSGLALGKVHFLLGSGTGLRNLETSKQVLSHGEGACGPANALASGNGGLALALQALQTAALLVEACCRHLLSAHPSAPGLGHTLTFFPDPSYCLGNLSLRNVLVARRLLFCQKRKTAAASVLTLGAVARRPGQLRSGGGGWPPRHSLGLA